MQDKNKSIALVGNPNCGKTTLFNNLTGASQKIGNWPGVTVEQHHGKYTDTHTQQVINVIDLPGCYSLIVTQDMALDERITCEYFLSAKDTIYVNVIDASHLSRDLYLSSQLLELGAPVIIALNCLDLAESAKLKIDVAALSARLGCPVIPMVAKTGKGIQQLKDAVSNYYALQNNYALDMPTVLHTAINIAQNNCKPAEILHSLEGNVLLSSRLITLGVDVENSRVMLQQQIPEALDVYIAQIRRKNILQILDGSVVRSVDKNLAFSSKIDNLVLHKVFGPLIFLGVMYFMFTCAINFGGLLQISFERIAEMIFIDGIQKALLNVGATTWFTNLVVDGFGRGISITLTFIPVLAAMFFCLGFLESSGYMARAAFIVDRLMSYLGLSGKSFVPMIVGFGCNVPAVMSTRSLSSHGERILTIMMMPFMSCSARLAIYAIFVAAFFPLGGQNVIFSLYLIGIAVAILTGLALRNTVAPTTESIGLMEMPEYRWPIFSTLLRQVWHRLKSFLVKAGLLIIVLCVIINGMGDAVLSSIGKFLTPMLAPMGIQATNWPATVGLVTGLIAKEAVVGTLNAFYATQESMINSFGSAIAAYSYLLFTLLYFPCVSVVAAISKELNFKWALFSVIWSTGLAYIIAALFYQIAIFNSWLWIFGLTGILVSFFVTARYVIKRGQKRVTQRKVLPTTIRVTQ